MEVHMKMRTVEDCELIDLTEARGIVIGSPTYFGHVVPMQTEDSPTNSKGQKLLLTETEVY